MLRSIESGMTRPCWRRSSGTKPMPAAMAAFGEAGGSLRPCTSTPPASARSMPKIARATSERPAPTRPASATISPALTSNETSVKTPSRVSRSTLSTVAPTWATSFGKSASMSRPTIAWISCCVVVSAVGCGQDVAPVAHHRDALAEREDLVEAVRDEEHRGALGAQRLDDAEEAVDLGRGQRRGRLVHHDHARLGRERLGDLDDLLVGDREPARDAVGVELDAELRRTAARPRAACLRRSMRRPLRSGCAPMKTFSATVRSGKSVGSWKMIAMPAACDCAVVSKTTSSPSISTRPLSGRCTPARILTSVDLPAPFSPTSACASPRRSSIQPSTSACTAPKLLLA